MSKGSFSCCVCLGNMKIEIDTNYYRPPKKKTSKVLSLEVLVYSSKVFYNSVYVNIYVPMLLPSATYNFTGKPSEL
jgi:hypothetical protein